MKKIVTFFLVFLLIFSFAFAEIDVASLSDDDLLALKEDVEEEISERGLVKSLILYPGQYIVGIDFEEGIYLLDSPTKEERADSTERAYVWIYSDSTGEEELGSGDIGMKIDHITGEKIDIPPIRGSLENGQMIYISDGYLKLTKQ